MKYRLNIHPFLHFFFVLGFVLIFIALAQGDTPPPRAISANLYDKDDNGLSSTANGLKQGLDVHSINSLSDPALHSVVFGSSVIDPRERQWSLLNSTDSITSFQGGAWTVKLQDGDGIDLSSTNVSGQQSLDVNVTQSALPNGAATSANQATTHSKLDTINTSVTSSQSRKLQDGSGNNVTSQSNGSQRALDVGVNVLGVQVDPRQIRSLTGSDQVTALQGTPGNLSNGWPVKPTDGTNSQSYTGSGEAKASITQPLPAGSNTIGSISNVSGTISLPTGASTSANQTNGSQKTQVVDSGGNVQPSGDITSRAIFTKLTDGTNTTSVKGASTAATATDSSAVVALSPNSPLPTGSNTIGSINNVSGTVSLPTGASTSSNQTNGSQKTQVVDSGGNVQPSGDIASRAIFTKVTDGTNTAAVKGSSTAATVTDSSAVVALSPNSPLPTGTNSIGSINNVSGTVSLPTGASTSANQTNGSHKTQIVDGSGNTVGPTQAIGGTNYEPVVLAASATPGSATVARSIQVAGSDGSNAQTLSTDATGKLNLNNISGTISLPTGATTEFTLSTLNNKVRSFDLDTGAGTENVTGANLRFSANGGSVEAGTNANPLRTDPTGTTNQPVLLKDASGSNVTLGQKITSSSLPVVIASDQSNYPVKAQDGSGNNLTSQANGSQRALDVGVNVSGVQIDPRQIRSLSESTDRIKAQLQDNSGNGISSTLINSKQRLDVNLSSSGSPGSTVPFHSTAVGGKDGSGNLQTLRTDSNGVLSVISNDQTTTGSITSTQSITQSMNGLGIASFVISGTWSGTLIFEGSVDGSTFIALDAYQPTASSQTTVSSTTTNGTFIFTQASGMTQVRVRGNSVSSGSASVTIRAGTGRFNDSSYVRSNGNSNPTYGVMVGGTDGTNFRFLSTDNSGNLETVGSVASGATDSGNPIKTGGKFNSTAPAFTNGQRGDTQIDALGNTFVNPGGRSFQNFTTATTSTLKSGSGRLIRVCINTNAGNGNTLTMYDNTSASGTTIGLITTSGGSVPGNCGTYDLPFSTGLTIVTTGTSNWTVVYQ